jgi:hypothetical protein
MKKIDFKKELKEFYNPSSKLVSLINVPKRNFIMADGDGNPNTSKRFQECIEALFSVSYNLKFMIKKGNLQIDYGVMPLEGLWWCDDMKEFSTNNKEIWKWTIMIMQPDFITESMFEEAIRVVEKKKGITIINDLSFAPFTEGESIQMMHIGPFSTEADTLEKMNTLILTDRLIRSGKHHEIYLNDFRKISPEKMKTVLRQPVKRG